MLMNNYNEKGVLRVKYTL